MTIENLTGVRCEPGKTKRVKDTVPYELSMSNRSSNMRIGEYGEDHLLKITKKLVQEKMSKTPIFESDNSEATTLPLFEKSELDIGSVLGRGGFCVVSQVNLTRKDGGASGHRSRQQNQESALESSIDTPYAIKELSESSLKDVDTYVNGIVDLAMEAKWLASVQHPNIISIRGVSSEAPYSRHFFIVIDRLHEILTFRIQTWKKQKPSGISKKLLSKSEREKLVWRERVLVAHGIASALAYLHSQHVIHRDLKPDDIGFNVQGDVKLFDFGLAKQYDPSKADENGCYQMTAFTGSLRYMAPEVALGKPCNETTDCYSFGLLLYQILALEAPFYGLTVKNFPNFVFEKGARPKPDAKWPTELSSLMRKCWSPNIRDRPSMAEASKILFKHIHVNQECARARAAKLRQKSGKQRSRRT